MQSQNEIAQGTSILNQYASDRGLSLSDRRLRDGRGYYFEIKDQDRWFDFVLSDEFLMDLPGTPGHKAHIHEYLPAILTRFQNSSPRDFLARSGTPFSLRLHWPFKPHPTRDVIWCHAEVEDLRFPNLIAMTTPAIWLLLDDAEFKFRPLARIEAVVNAIRDMLDRSEIQFYRRNEHPSQTQEIPILDRQEFARVSDDFLEQFIAAKVFWLAFKRGDQSTRVWIADPWDASYLGVTPEELIRAGQTVKARGIIELTSDQFASPGDALLLSVPAAARTDVRIGFQLPNQ
jgi:hypothetical protein